MLIKVVKFLRIRADSDDVLSAVFVLHGLYEKQRLGCCKAPEPLLFFLLILCEDGKRFYKGEGELSGERTNFNAITTD